MTADGNPFSPSLFVAAGIVTANRTDRVIVNAGYKALATDSGKAVPMRGAAQGSTYRFMGDEHGAVEFIRRCRRRRSARPSSSSPRIAIRPSISILATWSRSGEEIVDEWPVTARGY